ncbi:MAG: hypothetical protein J6J60_02300 [Clostridia bacterium]|nr:hypothetical protein [Clostridia bacterium]
MGIFKNLFDDFTIHARIMPALITALPTYIYLMIVGIIEFGFIDIICNSWIFILLVAIYYRFIRNLGKKYEEKMYKVLGGKPTTIILRYSDDNIDEITKTRYHKKLNKKIVNLNLPLDKEHEKIEDDVKYESAINWLRNYANTNREKEQRVYQELKEYNFYRNLYGGKIIIILSGIVCVVTTVIKVIMEIIKSIEIYKMYIIYIIFMLCILLLSCLIINKESVVKKAFDYAKTLLEVCERL